MPGFAGPGDSVDVENLVVLLIVEVQKACQRLLLLGCKRKVLFLANHRFPGQEVVFFQPNDEAIDRFLNTSSNCYASSLYSPSSAAELACRRNSRG